MCAIDIRAVDSLVTNQVVVIVLLAATVVDETLVWHAAELRRNITG